MLYFAAASVPQDLRGQEKLNCDCCVAFACSDDVYINTWVCNHLHSFNLHCLLQMS